MTNRIKIDGIAHELKSIMETIGAYYAVSDYLIEVAKDAKTDGITLDKAAILYSKGTREVNYNKWAIEYYDNEHGKPTMSYNDMVLDKKKLEDEILKKRKHNDKF